MTIAALITWLATACGGLFMFAIWLIEYERKKDGSQPAACPPPCCSATSCWPRAGLIVWISYLFGDDDRLARAALIILAAVALLGLTMLRRWISVYRDSTYSLSITAASGAGLGARHGHRPGRTQLPAGRGHRSRPVRRSRQWCWCC